jgi:hypothetical protein
MCGVLGAALCVPAYGSHDIDVRSEGHSLAGGVSNNINPFLDE